MKSVQIWVGDGDRVAPKVTVSLLSDEESLRIRALQELAKYNNVVRSRSIQVPVQQGLEVGDSRVFYYSLLGLTGRNLVTGFSISIGAEEGSAMEITMEQYSRLPANYQIRVEGEL